VSLCRLIWLVARSSFETCDLHVLHGPRLCSSSRSFRDEMKSGTTFLEIRSDLASTSSANFEYKWNFMPKLPVSDPDPCVQPCSSVCPYFAVTDEFNVHLTRVLMVVKQDCSIVDYFYLTIKVSFLIFWFMFVIFPQICVLHCTVLIKINVLSGSVSTFTSTQLLLKGHFKDTF